MTLPLVQVLSLPPLHHHHHPPQQSSLQQSAYTLTLAIQQNNNWTWDLDRVKVALSRIVLGLMFTPFSSRARDVCLAFDHIPWLSHYITHSDLFHQLRPQ